MTDAPINPVAQAEAASTCNQSDGNILPEGRSAGSEPIEEDRAERLAFEELIDFVAEAEPLLSEDQIERVLWLAGEAVRDFTASGRKAVVSGLGTFVPLTNGGFGFEEAS